MLFLLFNGTFQGFYYGTMLKNASLKIGVAHEDRSRNTETENYKQLNNFVQLYGSDK